VVKGSVGRGNASVPQENASQGGNRDFHAKRLSARDSGRAAEP
jgi:hypothetical protein